MRLRWWFALAAICAAIVQYFGVLSPPLNSFALWYVTIDGAIRGILTSILGAMLTAIVAWVALRTNASVNIRNKRMDVILHCNARYDELNKIRNEIDSSAEGDEKIQHLIDSYFRRYWGLQSDQIDYWLAGYVDPETMSSWVFSLADSLKNKSVGRGTCQKSFSMNWDSDVQSVHRVVNERLRETVTFARSFIGLIDDAGMRYAVTLQYLRIVEANERSLIKRLSRNYHQRMSVDDLAITVRDKFRGNDNRINIWREYNRFDIRRPLFRGAYRGRAFFLRRLSTFPDWLQDNSIDRLERAITVHLKKNSAVTSDAQLQDWRFLKLWDRLALWASGFE